MKTLGYYNGEIAEIEQLKIPLDDRSHYFGDGVYEAALVNNYVPFKLDEHIDRFYNSMSGIEIKPIWTKDELKQQLQKLVRLIDSPTSFLYWQVTRGTAPRTHAFPQDLTPNLTVTIRPLPELTFTDQTKEVTAITYEDIRYLMCNVKTLNLLPNCLAKEEAHRHNAYEAILHRGTRVTEGASTNVSILKSGKFITAPADNLILNGITRRELIRVCQNLGIEVVEKAFTLDELFAADEIIISSTSCFATRVVELDGKKVGGNDKKTLSLIQNEFWKLLIDYTTNDSEGTHPFG